MPFLPGLELCRRLYQEAVRPLLEEYFPDLPYAAARIGPGSDVLGFDTEMSMDHDWGPQLQLFLREQDLSLAPELDELFSTHLPATLAGFPVNFASESERSWMHSLEQGPINHRVLCLTLREFVQARLAYDLDQPLKVGDWLSIPSQKLLEMTAGAVYHDGIGTLRELRARLGWYPRDVWLYLLACGWQRLGEEAPLMARAGYVGDELGAAIIGSRLVRDVMSLCFLLERHYAPYPKWLGSAFQHLRCADRLWPVLWRVQRATTWQERETAFVEAQRVLAHMHHVLGLTAPLSVTVSPFYDRPFQVTNVGAFIEALLEQISDPDVLRVVERGLIGSIDQWSDHTHLREAHTWRSRVRTLYT
jgi:Domain of unknown function (DUF4037)